MHTVRGDSPPVNSACPNCGTPAAELAHVRHLLEAWDAARRDETAAQAVGDRDAVDAAGWVVTERLGNILKHKEDAATSLAMQLRWMAELYPDAVGPFKELGERIADLKSEMDELREECDEQRERIANLETVLTSSEATV